MALPRLILAASPTNALQRLDPIEVEILQFRGAFDLPPKEVQDEFIDRFFCWVAPILPIINQRDFLARYHDPVNPPSLLLLQAIFLSVSRVSGNIEGNDGFDSSTKMFVQRTKALYDAGYEQDPVTIVQSLILMSWYWHGPQDATENGLFYWSQLAIAVAEDNNMHRSDQLSHLTLPEHRLWRRIWWTLFTRDRAVSAAYGRPVSISLEHSSVEELTEDDFINDDEHPPNFKRVQFFLQHVKLSKILGMVTCRSVRKREHHAIQTECEYELNKWLLNCPEEMKWQQSHHEFWAAVLHCTYNTILCQLYGLQPIKLSPTVSQTVVSEAASMILSTVECLVSHNEVKYAPPSVLYSIFTVLVTIKDQLSTAIPSLVHQSQRKAKTCIQLLHALSQNWPIARMIGEISELIFSEKRFHEMLESTSKGSNREAENKIIPSRPIFKRSSLNPKQARPEFMLPRSRVILRMVLTNRSSQENRLRNKFPPPQSHQPSPPYNNLSVVCGSTAKSTVECTDPDLLLPLVTTEVNNTVSNRRTNGSGRFVRNHRETWESEEDCVGDPMIPQFGTGSWCDLDRLVAEAVPATQRECFQEGDQESPKLDQESLSLDFEEWLAQNEGFT